MKNNPLDSYLQHSLVTISTHDLDIVMESDHGLDDALQSVLQQGVFHRYEEDERPSQVPKQHYKFFFNSSIERKESSIILDILFDKSPYPVYQ